VKQGPRLPAARLNDIGHPGSAAPLTDEVSAEEIEAGLRQFVARAHEKGIKVFGAPGWPKVPDGLRATG
jgi:hypothetical protein